MAGELTTTNYGWVKPTVGSSTDAWGGYLNTDLDGIDSTVKSVSNAIPAASSTTPAMDGIAAVGTGTTWARSDHVHPTDTSRASVAAVNALPLAMNDNRIINAGFALNQRVYVSGTALSAAAYGHDRWKAGASGCTYTFTTTPPDTTVTITAGTLTQVIEAGVIEGGVYTLSWTGTAQARVYQGAPTGSYAASPITTASLTAGTNTIVEFNTGTVTRVKLEIGSAVTPFPRQSMAKSLADCQRYYQFGTAGLAANGTAGITIWTIAQLPVTMRANPAYVLSGQTYSNATAGAMAAFGGSGSYQITATVTATAFASFYFNYTASAEL